MILSWKSSHCLLVQNLRDSTGAPLTGAAVTFRIFASDGGAEEQTYTGEKDPDGDTNDYRVLIDGSFAWGAKDGTYWYTLDATQDAETLHREGALTFGATAAL